MGYHQPPIPFTVVAPGGTTRENSRSPHKAAATRSNRDQCKTDTIIYVINRRNEVVKYRVGVVPRQIFAMGRN